ncbi:hypothetical protein JTE90_012840 [Oedothorax gibbosus]|uniref:Uncharacterized protein n=1 Tax=Oedothorax gibbosus TaxID=931172 RepID=A0AAV6TE39_9ARAC|nr:hypothetical protein JTE90_012840 [Oedothorax gibbosus]
MGLAPTLGNSPGQGDLLQSPSPARSLLNATFPHALASGGFGAGLLPVHSPLLRESLRFSTHHVPRCILQRGEETTRVEKDDKRVELATRTAFNSHHPQPMLRSQYAPYSHRNNFRDGAHGRGPDHSQEAET